MTSPDGVPTPLTPTDVPRSPLVTMRDAALTFGRGDRAVVAVHGSSCVVGAGDRIAVVGASGSGKSTLLHLLAGLEVPTAGTVSWPGLDEDALRRRMQVGVVFQSPSLVPTMTVAENVELPLVLAGLPVEVTSQRVADALRRLEVEALAGQLPEELSGGQAQRVGVARVLAQRPRLLLADEPTGQLDGPTGRHVIDILLAATGGGGPALVVTTHDLDVAARLDDRWTMDAGRLSVPPPFDPPGPATPGGKRGREVTA